MGERLFDIKITSGGPLALITLRKMRDATTDDDINACYLVVTFTHARDADCLPWGVYRRPGYDAVCENRTADQELKVSS